jgi:AcrR family transcriptional regulator
MKILRPTSRSAIIEASFEILSKNPSASLTEIAERAGVGRATLHRHFPGRDELIRELTLKALKDMDEAAEKACKNLNSYSECIHAIMSASIPLGDRYGFLENEPWNSPEVMSEVERQNKDMLEIIDKAKEEGLFEASIPASWIVRVFDNLIIAAWESIKAEDITPKQATELAWTTFTSGLKGSS